MNKVFKVIWNEARNAYVVVSEIAKNRGSKSCSTKKLLAMLIATGVMTCASFDVLAAEPTAAETAQFQYVAFYDETADLINGQDKLFGGHKYIYDATNKYWVREGYVLVVEKNGKLHTPLSANGKSADVLYTGGGDTGSILQSVASTVSANGTVTNMGESLNRITASAFAGVSHGGGTAVAGDWAYIIQNSSWKDSVAPENYKDGYADLIDKDNGMPKGFKTAEDPNTELNWDATKQAYTYKGKPVDYSNVYVINGKIGVFTNKDGSEVYKGTVFGKNNEILMTVKDANNKFYSYWASEVTDPSATMQSYRMTEYKKDLSVLEENDNKLHRDDIKEVTMTTDASTNSAIIGLVRNGNTEAGAPVTGAITVTSGGGTSGNDTFVKISNGTAEQTFATGSKVEAIGAPGATTGFKINGVDYTIKSGSGVEFTQDPAKKTTTITVDGNKTTITDTDTTYTAGAGIEINGDNAISVSKNLTGMESITGAGEDAGSIHFDGANVKVNNTTFSENSVVVGVAGDGKSPVQINGESGEITGLNNTKVGYTDFAVNKGKAATEGQLKQVMDEGWKFTTDSGNKTTVKVGPDGTNDNAVTFKGDGTNIAVTNTGKDIKVELKKDLTVDSVKAGDTTVNTNGLTIGTGIVLSKTNVSMGGQQIHNVAEGTNDTDAVNFGQLKKVSNNSVNIDFTNISNNGKTEIVNIAKAADVHVKDGQYSVQEDGTVTMKYVDGNGNEVTGKELKITDVASAAKLDVLNTTVTDIGGRVTTNSTNITNLQGEVIISGSIGANGKVELFKDNGSKVEVGTVKDYSVTSGTYDQTTKKLTLTKTDAYGNATLGTVDIDLSGIQSGDKNWTAQANGTDVKPNADNKVNFINGDNTNVTTSGDGVIAVNLNKNLTGLTSVTTNNAYVTNVDNNNNNSVTNVQYVNEQIAGVTLTEGNGISITDKKINVKLNNAEKNLVVDSNGLALNTALTGIQSITGAGAGSISFADGGIKLNNKVTIDNTGKITGVADGTIAAGSTDAVNGSQLNDIKNSINTDISNKTFGLKDDKGSEVTNTLGNTVQVKGADGITSTVKDGALEIGLKLQDNSNLVVDSNGLALNTALTGIQSITGAGTGAGSISFNGGNVKVNQNTFNSDGRIQNVANGTETKDAVNFGQLDATNKKVDNLTTEVGKGWTVATENGTATKVGAGDTVKFSGADDNIKVSNDGKDVKVELNKKLTVDSVKAGDFFMDKNEGVGYKGKAYITSSGLNANGQTITNVKAGEAETDAVNVGQLNAVKAEASKKTTLSDGKNTTVTSVTTDGQTDYQVNVAGDLKDITSVSNGASKINLNADSISISNGNKSFSITNSGIGMSYIGADYTAKSIMLGENGTTISGGLDVAGSKITGVAAGAIAAGSTDAVNGSQLNDVKNSINTDISNKTFGLADDNGTALKQTLDKTIKVKGADGITSTVKDGALEIGLKLQEGSNLVVDSNGLALNTALTGIQSITGAGAGSISFADGGNVKVNDVTIEKGGKITGVAAGTNDSDAVNVSQLNAVKAEASKKTTLSDGKNTTVTSVTTDGQTDYQVNVAGDLKDITSVSNGASKINLNADSISISNGNKSFSITNSGIGMSYIGADYTAKSIMLGENGTTISGGLNVAGSKITGVAAGTADTDAVNVSQLNKVSEIANKGWKLKTNNGNVSDVKPGDEVEFDGDDNIKVSNAGNKVSFKLNNKLTGIESITGVGGGSISFSGGNVTINNNVTFGSNGQIHNVTAGTASTDAVNVGQLNAAVQAGNTDTHIKPGEYGVGADNKVNMDVVDKTGTKINTVTITDVAKASDLGNVNNINNDLKNSNGTTTVVDAVNNLNQKLDNKVGDLQYSKVDKGDIADGDSTTTAIGKLDQKLNDVAATAAKQHTTVSGSGNIVVEDPTINADGGKNYNVKLADDINVNSVTANTFKADKTIMDKDGLKVGEKVSVTENAVTAGKTSISDEGVKVGDKTYISDKGLNANGQNITNVADGKVEKDSKDAINGGQLFDTETKINNRIDGVENQVISNSNRIGQLSSRVNKVGAGAAALAALHPMDFDPDDKLTFSAGYGNYAGQNAAAIGAYYRPDEKVMFSVGGTVGNGENMVNAGISFSLDRTNHVSNSRTALAREVIDLRGQLAEMGAKMAKMEKAFGMLDESKTKLFPDIPANHWAYEYIAKLAGNGYVEGYPDGNFGGDRLMTRYEFAAMLYRAIENGAALEERIIKEFEPELGRIRVDRISGEDGDRDKIERVRVNATKGERDHYGNKLAK